MLSHYTEILECLGSRINEENARFLFDYYHNTHEEAKETKSELMSFKNDPPASFENEEDCETIAQGKEPKTMTIKFKIKDPTTGDTKESVKRRMELKSPSEPRKPALAQKSDEHINFGQRKKAKNNKEKSVPSRSSLKASLDRNMPTRKTKQKAKQGFNKLDSLSEGEESEGPDEYVGDDFVEKDGEFDYEDEEYEESV